jgi:peroxiredoxin
LTVGTRPASLLPGATIRTAVVEHGDGRLILGQAMPGQYQLLLFERGHWCSSCRRHLALIADDGPEFARREIDIVAITHEPAGELKDRIYPFPVIADPDLSIAMSFDLVGVDEFGMRTIRPASVVVDDRGTIVFSYVGDDSRDRPTIPALLLALDNIV